MMNVFFNARITTSYNPLQLLTTLFNSLKHQIMKTILLFLFLLVAGSAVCFAQCDKKVILTTSKTDHLDAGGALVRTVNETAVVHINKSALTIVVNDEHTMTAVITSNVCNWTVPYKEGKTEIKAKLNEDGGNINFSIVGKDGKITILFEKQDEPNEKLRVTVAKFEEEK
jgi:hypothetical protein